MVAQHSATEPGAIDLVEQIRNQPVAIMAFGVGLLLLAMSGICLAIMWRSVASGTVGWAAAPLGGLMVLLLPQFYHLRWGGWRTACCSSPQPWASR